MDYQRAKILIKKINSLFSSIEIEESQLSTIEKDLMLKYIRDLYDEFVGDHPKVIGSSSNTEKKSKKKKKEKALESKPVFQSPPPPTTTMAPPPVYREEPTTTTLPPPPPPPTTTTSAPVVQKPPSSKSTGGGNAKVEQLFSFKRAQELSEKLSEQPIRDLSTALSINDKLLYTNELFGRNHGILNESLNTLNRFDSMDQARSFLLSLAEQYDWGDDERSEIARSFIKTIRRRYLS